MRDRLQQVVLWLLLSLGTAFAWFLAWGAVAIFTFSSGIWDPDEVETYLTLSSWYHLRGALISGVFVGLVVAVLIGLFLVAMRRNIREIVLPVVATVIGTMALCALVQVGPASLYGGSPWLPLRLGAAAGIVSGTFCGLWQQVLLYRHIPPLKGWLFWTVICWAAAWGILWPLADIYGTDSIAYQQIPAFVAAGAVSGLGPWWILRKYVRRAGWFVLAASLGWGVIGVFWTSRWFLHAGVALMGAIIGATLVWLVAKNIRHQDESDAVTSVTL